MATFSDSITLYTHWTNPADRSREKWIRAPINGVSFYGRQAVSVSGSGLNTADQYTVRIPVSSMPPGYLPPDAFSRSAVPGGWTLQNGDVIVKGTVADEIVKGITEITRKYVDCFVITSVSDNRRGVPAMQHMRVEGK